MKKLLIAGILLLAFAPKASTEGSCNTKNKAFKHGEKVIFHVYYTVAGLWVHAGNVSFTATLSMLNNKPAYHVVADGSTLSSYDWIYRVRDRYETYIDTATLLPQKFIRNVDEGGYKIYENVTFYHDKKRPLLTKVYLQYPHVHKMCSAKYTWPATWILISSSPAKCCPSICF
jgi:hypothetical protein